VRVPDIAGGRVIDLTGPGFPLAFNPAFSPDGESIYFVSKDRATSERPQLARGDIYRAQLGSDIFDNITGGAVSDVWSVHPSPAGRELLLYTLYGQSWYEPPRTSIRIIDPASGTIRQIAASESMMGPPVWAPDGRSFAWAASELSLRIAGKGESLTIDAPAQLSNEIAWAPNSSVIVAFSMIGNQPSLLVDLQGEQPATSAAPIVYDAEAPYFGPPQWMPLLAPLDPADPGAGLDHRP
jgi:Tol biopolymer transport system component